MILNCRYHVGLYRIIVSDISLETRCFGQHFCCRMFTFIFNHFYAMRPEAAEAVCHTPVLYQNNATWYFWRKESLVDDPPSPWNLRSDWPTPPHFRREYAFSNLTCKILKLAYYRNYCTDINQFFVQWQRPPNSLRVLSKHAYKTSKSVFGDVSTYADTATHLTISRTAHL